MYPLAFAHYTVNQKFTPVKVRAKPQYLRGWVGAVSELLQPLVSEIQRTVLRVPKLPVDDTPVKVQEPGNGKTRTAGLWAHVHDKRNAGSKQPPAVWFNYTRS